ncbi:hypothetical protein Tco_1116845, partial [Tanacetum coccineum]
MFDANAEDELWHNQERWNLKSWDFYENCGVHTLILEDGTKIHMLAERNYPLTKEILERMLSLRLVAGTASEDAYTLLRFIQNQIDEYGSHDGALAIPEQKATSKEISNPFMAASLNAYEKAAVVTAVTTAGAIDQSPNLTLQVTFKVPTCPEARGESVHSPTDQHHSPLQRAK